MFFCSAWNAKKDKTKYRAELEESPGSRRRLVKSGEKSVDDDSDLSDTDEAYSSAAEVDSPTVKSDVTKSSGVRRLTPRTGGGGLVTEVLLDFEPLPNREGRELAVKKGDVVRVLFRSGQWLYVTMGLGKEGYVPAGYCRAFAPPELQAAGSDDCKQNEQQGQTARVAGSGASDSKFERGKCVVALYNFVAQEQHDLDMLKGDCLTVTHSGDGEWVWVKNGDGRKGCVPATYIAVKDSVKPTRKLSTSSDDRRDSELLLDILSTIQKRHRNPTAPTTRSKSSDASKSHSTARSQQSYENVGIPGRASVRAHSALDLREMGTRMATAGVPVNRQRQRQNPQLRRFAPKLQRPDLAPIKEAELHSNRLRGDRQEVRIPSPSCDHTSSQEAEILDESRRPKEKSDARQRRKTVGGSSYMKYPNRSTSFQHGTAGRYGRQLQEKILSSQSLRPADFSFDNIAQLLQEQATGRPCVLADKLQALTSSMISTTSGGSSGGSTSPPVSSPARRLDINRLQLEARLRLSHSRLGIHSSFTSIPMISTSPHQPRRPLPPPLSPEQSWAYSNV